MGIERIIQENADSIRILKVGLRNHDVETVMATHSRISNNVGRRMATEVVFRTITRLMGSENWSFFDKDGNPSPLL